MKNLKFRKHIVLHITPHLGGGVGRVLLNYLEKVKENPDFLHKVLSLEYANDTALSALQSTGFSLTDKMSANHYGIIAAIAAADIVLIHWWNHPLLYDFLVRTELPPCRMVMWSHISGFHPPYVFTEKILRYPDLFVFTTPVSYETKDVQNLSDEIKKRLRVVWSTGGIDHVKSVKPQAHTGFNIGYIGNVDYAKLHPNFLTLCSNVDIPNVKFIVCGGLSEKKIMREAEQQGISAKFKFTGLISDITEYLKLFDVFGYPLAAYHYGTCDQVLAESMAAGVVPVVLPNRMEKYMVKDGISGIVAKDENGYVEALRYLYDNKDLRITLSNKAKEYAIKTFSLDAMIKDLESIFEEVLTYTKTPKKWDIIQNTQKITAMDVFLESLGNYGKDFYNYLNAKSKNERIESIKRIKKLAETALWKSETKGTAHHYNYFFRTDKSISVLSQLMREQ